MSNEHVSMRTWQIADAAYTSVLAEILLAIDRPIDWNTALKNAKAQCNAEDGEEQFIQTILSSIEEKTRKR